MSSNGAQITLDQQQLIQLNTLLAQQVFGNDQNPVLNAFRTARHAVTEDGKHYEFNVSKPYDPLDGMVQRERYEQHGLARFDNVAKWAQGRFPKWSTKVSSDTVSGMDETPYFVKVVLDLTDPNLVPSLLAEMQKYPVKTSQWAIM